MKCVCNKHGKTKKWLKMIIRRWPKPQIHSLTTPANHSMKPFASMKPPPTQKTKMEIEITTSWYTWFRILAKVLRAHWHSLYVSNVIYFEHVFLKKTRRFQITARWNHIEDLDSFFTRMYYYHQKHGFNVMMVNYIMDLVIFAFVVWFVTAVAFCVDYNVLDG